MKTITKKIISALLAAALILALPIAMPLTAHAANADALTFQINHQYSHGGSGSLSAVQSGKTVTVTGSVANATEPLSLSIDADVKVIWKAVLTGSANGLVNLAGSGKGVFEVAKGGAISSSDKFTIYNPSISSCSIIVSGGKVDNTAKDGIAIRTKAANAKVSVSGGQVTATGMNATAISLGGAGSKMTVSGGLVDVGANSESGNAIYSGGANVSITVSGGEVKAMRDAIRVAGASSVVKVSGGTIESNGPLIGSAIYITAASANTAVNVSGGTIKAIGAEHNHAVCSDGVSTKVEISGGTAASKGTLGTVNIRGETSTVRLSGKGRVKNTGAGDAILGNDVDVQVKGGTVSAKDGGAIKAYTVTISGGTVSAAGAKYTIGTLSADVTGGTVEATGKGNAIEAKSADVKGGTVCAKSGFAISISGAGSLKASGGFVFAYGTALAGAGNVIQIDGGSPAIGGKAVVCAWNNPGGTPAYTKGSATGLTANSGAAAKWGKSGSKSGIDYKNGSNKGFFSISGINVNAEKPTPTPVPTPTLAPTPSATSDEDILAPDGSATVSDDDIIAPEDESGLTFSEMDGENKNGFNWMWVVLIGLAIVAIGCGVAFVVIRKKEKGHSNNTQKE